MNLRYGAYATLAVLLILGSLAGYKSCRKSQGSANEIQSAVHQGEAQTYAQTAQAIPDHTAAIQAAEARAKASENKAGNLKRERDSLLARLAAVPSVSPDLRDEVIVKDAEVIQAQRVQIEDQTGQIAVLGLALKDEQHRSAEFQAAYESERKATAAQAAATEAWKKAVTASRWQGRIEGFAAGVALGYVGGKR